MGLKFTTVKRDSLFTKMDFRPKFLMILVITVIALLWGSPVLLLGLGFVVLAASLAAGVEFKFIRLVLAIMLPFYMLLLATHGFFNQAQVMRLTGRDILTPILVLPDNLWLVGGLTMTLEGLWYGISVVLKTLSIVLLMPLLIFTTDMDNMIVGLVRAKVPYKLAFIFSSTMRFFPLLFGELGQIIEAQRLRGLAIEKMNFIQRIRVYATVAVPLILSAMVRSQELDVILQSKAFSGDPDRTYLHESQFTPLDYGVVVISSMILILVLILYFGWGVGRFGGAIDGFLF